MTFSTYVLTYCTVHTGTQGVHRVCVIPVPGRLDYGTYGTGRLLDWTTGRLRRLLPSNPTVCAAVFYFMVQVQFVQEEMRSFESSSISSVVVRVSLMLCWVLDAGVVTKKNTNKQRLWNILT